MLTRAGFVAMTIEATDAQRRGQWLKVARERSNLSQPAAAKLLGLSGKSASTLSAWEAGTREPSPSKLKAMAALYEVPLSLFYDPPPSPIEQVDRMVSLAGLAIAAEAADWDAQAPAPGPSAEGEQGEQRRRQSA
jgi:transcriptional regulator with XRE-family HTH domain